MAAKAVRMNKGQKLALLFAQLEDLKQESQDSAKRHREAVDGCRHEIRKLALEIRGGQLSLADLADGTGDE